jgi:hypothetical protein
MRPSVVIALELLGLDTEGALGAQLRRVLGVLERDFGDMELLDRRLLCVGHRLFRLAPITPHVASALAFRELLDVVHLQADLLQRGVLLRGVVTLGSAASRADIAVGAVVSEAERLCKLAEVPRVIVDPRLLREVESNENLREHDPLTELGYIRELLRQDADGLWFVDYLKAASTELDEPALYPEFLEEHRSLVEKRLGEHLTLDRASRAATWLWSYHNQVVEEWFTRKRLDGEQRARLRLPAQSPLVYAFPPSAKAPG